MLSLTFALAKSQVKREDIMKIKPLALALTAGIFWGAAVMLATWWLLIRGSGGSTIVLLGNFYLGYSFSWIGSII